MSDSPMTQQAYPPLSVVIPTLGGETPLGTIEQLNRGTLVPAEILVCIPEEDMFRLKGLSVANVRVIKTKCRGQVAQRAIGFQHAQHPMVLQLDDDIMVDENCVAHLLQTLIKYGPNVAVGPALLGRSLGEIARMKDTMLGIYYFLVNGRDGSRMGTVSRAGAEFGYDRSKVKEGVHDVEWVPGGCVIHFKENLITENHFPFKGKAYGEDLLHCYHLAKKGVRLKVDLDAHCSLENVPTASYGIREFTKTMYGTYRSHKYFVKLSSRSYLRMHLYYMAWVFNFLVKKLIAKIR